MSAAERIAALCALGAAAVAVTGWAIIRMDRKPDEGNVTR